MTEKDKRLVARATKRHYYDADFWEVTAICEEQAQSEEAKTIIHRHIVSEYHKEEYHSGME